MEEKPAIDLRPFDEEKDILPFHRVYSDSVSMRYYGMRPYTDIGQSRKLICNYIDSEINGQSIHRVICGKFSDEYMGEIGIFNLNFMHHRANADCILLPEYRKRGISIEASKLFYKDIFQNWQINRIQAFVDCRNTGAIRSLEGIGFSFEGILSQYEFFEGEYVNMAIFALIKEKFYELYS